MGNNITTLLQTFNKSLPVSFELCYAYINKLCRPTLWQVEFNFYFLEIHYDVTKNKFAISKVFFFLMSDADVLYWKQKQRILITCGWYQSVTFNIFYDFVNIALIRIFPQICRIVINICHMSKHAKSFG